MIKVILLDIDGTLTNDEKVITPKTLEALRRVQESGVRLAIASGRPPAGLGQFARPLGMFEHDGIFVCYNGAQVRDCQTGEIYFNQAMSVEDGKEVLEHMKKFDVWPIIDRGDYMYTNDVFAGEIPQVPGGNVIQYEAHGNSYLLCEKADLAEFADWEINKILVAGRPEYLQEHYREMGAPFEGRLNSMFTADWYYEFTALGIDKANAIKTAFESMGYTPDEMMAFGDAPNDKTMLSYVGCGVCMGNGADECKEVADEVTASNNEDGIAQSLYRHFPELFA